MLFRDSQLRNRHLNRIRQDGLPPLPGIPGAEGDDDDEVKPPVGPTATQPGPTSTRENPVANKPPASTSTSTPTPSASRTTTTTTTTTQPPANTNTQSTPPPPPPTSEDNAQPTVSNPLVGGTQTADPGTINNNNGGGGGYYTNTYSQGDASMIISPSTTSTSEKAPEGSSNTVKYIGYAAGAIVGFALLVSLIMFIMRRLNKKRENEALGDVFDRNSFVRDSVAIPDHGDDLPGDRGRPRPPTMIARHIGATGGNNTPFAGGYDGGYGGGPVPPMPDNGGYYGNNDGYNGNHNGYNGNNGGYNGNGYDQYSASHGYNGGYDQQYDQYAHYAPPQQGYGAYQDSPVHSPMDPYSDHSAQYLNHQVGSEYPAMPATAATSPTDTGRTLTRQPSSGAHGADYPNVAELGRGTSVTPYQAAQYAEIGKRLDDPTPNGAQGYNKVDHHPGQQRQPTLDDAYGGI